jgi:hypothetical protein
MQQIALFVPRPGEQEDAASDTASLGAELDRSNEDSDGSRIGSSLEFESNPSRQSKESADDQPDEQQNVDLISEPEPGLANDILTDFQPLQESANPGTPPNETPRNIFPPGTLFL